MSYIYVHFLAKKDKIDIGYNCSLFYRNCIQIQINCLSLSGSGLTISGLRWVRVEIFFVWTRVKFNLHRHGLYLKGRKRGLFCSDAQWSI